MAAPIASQVLGEVLPYLGIKSGEETVQEMIKMPNVTGITVQEAKTILNELGIEIELQGEIYDETIITKQVPSEGIQVNTGTKILLYGD